MPLVQPSTNDQASLAIQPKSQLEQSKDYQSCCQNWLFNKLSNPTYLPTKQIPMIQFTDIIKVNLQMLTINNCLKHSQEITHLCLAEQCKQDLFMCLQCNNTPHKHSKTDIKLISQIKEKLKEAWEPKQSVVEPYFDKVKTFYENLKASIKHLIEEDERKVQEFLIKVKYYHLPLEANSQAYLEFMRQQYERLDKSSILNLLNQAESGSLNKDLSKQAEITNFLDLQLKKVNEKVLTLEYVLLSKKFKNQLLVPHLPEPSKIANHQDFIKIYSFFNSRNLPIRSAKLVYRASQNDFSPKSFYNCCNGVTNSMALVRTANNKLIGGFCPLPLVHHDEEQLTEKGTYAEDKTKRSFIFNISNLKSYSLKDSRRAIKYKKNSPGPSFGEDLEIGESVTSSVGHSYECDANISIDSLQAKVYLLQAQNVQIKDLQIWQLSF